MSACGNTCGNPSGKDLPLGVGIAHGRPLSRFAGAVWHKLCVSRSRVRFLEPAGVWVCADGAGGR